jgi:hypothetical protein
MKAERIWPLPGKNRRHARKSAERIIEATQDGAWAQEAAMRLRPHRRNLVVWSQSAGPAGRDAVLRRTPASRIRRRLRIGVLLTTIGLMRLGGAVRARWRPVLAGTVLTAVGVMLRGGVGGMVLLPGLMLLASAPLVPAGPEAGQARRSKLERELAGYSTPAQRRDLEATLDRYPDSMTRELREILARQAMAGRNHGIPGTGRY